MKTKFLLLFFFLYPSLGISFPQSFPEASPSSRAELSFGSKSPKEEITIIYRGKMYYKIPNLITVRVFPKQNLRVSFDAGSVRRLSDTTFEVTPDRWGNYKLAILGNRPHIATGRIERLPAPDIYYLQGIQDSIYNSYQTKGTVLNSFRNPRAIEARFEEYSTRYLYRIKQFRCRLYVEGSQIQTFTSPVFHSNILDWDVLKTLDLKDKSYAELILDSIKVIGTDSIETGTNFLILTRILKDSATLILDKYLAQDVGPSKKVKSDVRIKIEGNPSNEDLVTVNKIVTKLNQLIPTLTIKLVRYFPSLTVVIDSTDKIRGDWKTVGKTDQRANINPFFPLLSSHKIFINSKINQEQRNIFLWKYICQSIAEFTDEDPMIETSILIGKADTSMLFPEDELAIKTIFSSGGDARIRELRGIHTPLPDTFVLLAIVLAVILFFTLYEISRYYNIKHLIRNEMIRDSLSVLIFGQIVTIAIKFIFPSPKSMYDDSFVHPFWQYDVYISGLSLLLIWFFKSSDKLLRKISLKWLQMLCNPVAAVLSLWVAYQILYWFTRGEFLRLTTIDSNAIAVALVIVIVRFYFVYENAKIASLVEENEYKLTKHKELQVRAELAALQARINPHFLYNALNSLAALASIDAKRVESMALNLSKLLRYNVNRNEEHTGSIGEEIEMVQLYLEIEKQRFGSRLNFTIDVNKELYAKLIPRFLIQPLVENAIKHGASKVIGAAVIKLKIYENEEVLYIEIADNGPAFPEGLVSGYGLQNTYDKLNLVYKRPYEIKFVNEPVKFIQIKLQ